MLSESGSSLTAAPHESDEAFALRLQAQELGHTNSSNRSSSGNTSSSTSSRWSVMGDTRRGSSASTSSSSAHGDPSGDGSSTPLLLQERRLLRVAADASAAMGRSVTPTSRNSSGSNNSNNSNSGGEDGTGGDRDNANPTVMNARLDEVAGARISLIIIAIVNIPQILTGAVVLPLGWHDGDRFCAPEIYDNWKYWVLVSTLRMAVFTALSAVSYLARDWLATREELKARITSLRNFADASGLVWFVVGNMWFFGDNTSCHNARNSPVFVTGVVMIAVNYVQICLPCVLALLLIPLFCCCMPCVIRVLARLQDIHSPKGASEAALASLPELEVAADSACANTACPICLNDMVVGERARELTCKHAFHKECVDEWLRVNATCPTCRSSIIPSDANSSTSTSASTSTTVTAAAEGASTDSGSRGRSGSGGSRGGYGSSSSSGNSSTGGEDTGVELMHHRSEGPPTSSILTSLSLSSSGGGGRGRRVLVPSSSDHGGDSFV